MAMSFNIIRTDNPSMPWSAAAFCDNCCRMVGPQALVLFPDESELWDDPVVACSERCEESAKEAACCSDGAEWTRVPLAEFLGHLALNGKVDMPTVMIGLLETHLASVPRP